MRSGCGISASTRTMGAEPRSPPDRLSRLHPQALPGTGFECVDRIGSDAVGLAIASLEMGLERPRPTAAMQCADEHSFSMDLGFGSRRSGLEEVEVATLVGL